MGDERDPGRRWPTWRQVLAGLLVILASEVAYQLVDPAWRLLDRLGWGGHPIYGIVILIGVFVTLISLAVARLNAGATPDDRLMFPLLVATGASFTVALVVNMRISDYYFERGLIMSENLWVLIFAVVMVPSIAVTFWLVARR